MHFRIVIGSALGLLAFLLAGVGACAATVMVLSDSAGVYLIDTNTGAVVQSYGSLFTGSSAQNLGQDTNGNLYVSNTSGQLLKSTLNPNAPTSATAYAASAVVAAIPGVGGTLARMSFDPTTKYCVGGCLVTMSNATTVLWLDPATAAVVKSLTLTGPGVSTNGDIVVEPTAANDETLYVVATHNLYTINATTGAVTGPVTLGGPTGSLTGAALLPNGHIVACEQKGSGTPWTLWEYTTAGASVGSHAGIATGSDVVNDLASIPATFAVAKNGTSAAGPNDSMAYSVALKNTGYFAAPTASIVDPVPNTVVISPTTLPSCAVAGGIGSCSITSAAGAQTVIATVSNLSAGATATLSIVGTPSASSGSAVNTATGSVPYDPSEYGGETLTSNSVTTTFTGSEMSKLVANITEGIGPGTSIIGKPIDVLEYTLTFTNKRGFPLRSFTISDPVPVNTAYVPASATCVTTPVPLTCVPAQAGGTVTYTYTGGSLPINGTVTVKFRVTIQ
ncbi:MAG TPA: hypothetical protein VIG32_12350 [Candidatus Baltobacteraceae bacterium]